MAETINTDIDSNGERHLKTRVVLDSLRDRLNLLDHNGAGTTYVVTFEEETNATVQIDLFGLMAELGWSVQRVITQSMLGGVSKVIVRFESRTTVIEQGDIDLDDQLTLIMEDDDDE